ncbi:MAG: nicotinamide mononucleotide transporter [Gammaproteobacteria bacterium]|nr:nicotinamide mononucleotide transporter [Gammaproteobacteria bacterium]|tara:strand:- start:1846 stop:2451 length:606 start_codon:yes stop_codon:yes gene_type:complete
MNIFFEIIGQLQNQSLLELVAVVSAIFYIIFVIHEKIICWFFAAISAVIYIWLFIEAKLYMESLLNICYLAIAMYGWYQWIIGKTDTNIKPIISWPLIIHIQAIICLSTLGIISGALLKIFSDAAFPFLDSLTTWFAIWATYLVARKVLENWWYWLAIDLISILIYWSRDLKLTSALFVVYVFMIPFGIINWTKSMRIYSR